MHFFWDFCYASKSETNASRTWYKQTEYNVCAGTLSVRSVLWEATRLALAKKAPGDAVCEAAGIT